MKILKPFFFGIIAALGALFLELLLATIINSPLDLSAFSSEHLTVFLVVAVLIEESLKFIFIYRSHLDLKIYFKNPAKAGREIFFHSLLIGIGFSLIELLFIFSGLSSLRDASTLRLALSGILIIHAATSSIMGYLLIRYAVSKFFGISAALITATAIHLFYNSLIIYSARPLFIFSYLLAITLVLTGMTFGAVFKKAAS